MGRKKEGKEYDILVAKKEAGSKHCRFYKQNTMFSYPASCVHDTEQSL